MRVRNFVAGFGLLIGAVGCHHTAGFCDCNPPITPCCMYGLHPAADYSIVVPAIAAGDAKPTAPAPKPTTPPPPAKPNPPAASTTSADSVKDLIGYSNDN